MGSGKGTLAKEVIELGLLYWTHKQKQVDSLSQSPVSKLRIRLTHQPKTLQKENKTKSLCGSG